MVLTYLPLNLIKCCNKYNITNTNTVNKDIYNVFKKFYEKSFCTFELIKGKNINSLCGNKIKDQEDIYCKRHKKYIKNNNKDIINFQCISKSRRRERCGRLVKQEGEYCFIHKKDKLKELEKIDRKRKLIYLILILYKYYISRKKNKNIYDLNKFKSVDCINIIKLLNIGYKIEGSTFRIKNNNYNIVINNNLFIDNKTGKGGKGILDLYLYITKKDISNFIDLIKKKKTNIFISFPTSNINIEKKPITNKKLKNKNSLVIENIQNINIVKKYLIEKRKINQNLINKLINKQLISCDINNNCIFYNKDKSYAHLRGTTDKRYFCSVGESNFIQYKTENNPLYLFESPIDMLSYMSLNNDKGDMVSLSGEMMINKVSNLINKYIKDIYLCFDNDEKGDEFCLRIKELLVNYKVNFKRLKSINKDWNEDLLKTNKN